MTWLESQDATLVTKRAALEATVQSTFTNVQVPSNPIIPVIFHVLHSDEVERINEAQLYSQMEALNRDYGFAPSTFTHEALDQEGFNAVSNQIGIEFCLPQFGNDSSAINYYPVARADWQFDNAMKNAATGGVAPWNPAQFLNVYVVDMHDTLAVAGYAQMPGGADSTDAIVIDYRFVGDAIAPYDMGRTLVHLVGNWMGLYSIWGVGDCDSNGDFVSDTPPHNAPNFGCPTYQHLSSCQHDKIVVEQSMNFMDASDDACLSIWTTAQKYRFFAFLQAVRKGINKPNVTCSSSPELVQNESDSRTKVTQEVPTIFAEGVKVYPNPGRDYVLLQLDLKNTAPLDIQVTTLNGQSIFEQKNIANTGIIRLVTDTWQTGLYLLSIQEEGQLIHAEKFAIQQ